MTATATAAARVPDAPAAERPHRRRAGWAVVVTVLVLTIMWIPIRRYALPLGTSFQLEPYRVIFLCAIIGTFVAVLSRTIRWRPVRFAVPLGIFIATLVLSIVVNAPRLASQNLVGVSVSGLVNLLFVLASFVVVRQAITDERRVMYLLKLLVLSGVVVAISAVFERITLYNVFLHFDKVLPLKLIADPQNQFRGGSARAYGSAQHPIALSVMLSMLIPPSVYLLRYSDWPRNLYHRRFFYGLCIGLLLLGVLSAISRTGVVVLGAMFLVTLVLRPRIGLVILSVMIPLLLAGIVISPGLVDNTFGAFLNVNQLIASQYTSAGWRGAGRLADLGPVFQQVQQLPFTGLGFSSRILNGPHANGDILDDQVLAILLETGVVGLLGMVIAFVTPPVLLLRYSMRRELPAPYTALAFAVAVSAVGYFAGAFFYDAFGFMQTLYLLGFLLAIGAFLLTQRGTAGVWREQAADPRAAPSLRSVVRVG